MISALTLVRLQLGSGVVLNTGPYAFTVGTLSQSASMIQSTGGNVTIGLGGTTVSFAGSIAMNGTIGVTPPGTLTIITGSTFGTGAKLM
jgi:hypothetical protein